MKLTLIKLFSSLLLMNLGIKMFVCKYVIYIYIYIINWTFQFNRWKLKKLLNNLRFYISTKSWKDYILIAVCLCCCVSVFFLSGSREQNSSLTDAPILTQFLLNSDLLARTLLKWITWGQMSMSRLYVYLSVNFHPRSQLY